MFWPITDFVLIGGGTQVKFLTPVDSMLMSFYFTEFDEVGVSMSLCFTKPDDIDVSHFSLYVDGLFKQWF